MKEHALSKAQAENVVISESIFNHINDAKRKDDERLRKRLWKMQGGCRIRKKKNTRKRKCWKIKQDQKGYWMKKRELC